MTRINDNGIDRDMTGEEQKAYKVGADLAAHDEQTQNAAFQKLAAAKQSARAKLASLGLTDEEINAFLGT